VTKPPARPAKATKIRAETTDTSVHCNHIASAVETDEGVMGVMVATVVPSNIRAAIPVISRVVVDKFASIEGTATNTEAATATDLDRWDGL
jgi:hypothetical protein